MASVAMRGRAIRPLVTEMGLLLVLFAFYKWGRTLFEHGSGVAMENAARLWRFERSWLPNEVDFQQWALGWDHTAFLANVYYVGVHFPGTALLLVWLYVRHRSSYGRVRNELVALTAAGLVVHMLFPLAPPRLAGIGAVDTMLTVGPSAYPAEADGLANQYAAMPSLHIGWAILVAVAVLRVSRSRWRWVIAMHAPVTVFVVVVTANHYWVDGIVAGVLLVVAMALVSLVERVRQGWGHAADAHESRDTGRARGGPADREPRATRPVPAAGDGHGDRLHDRAGDRDEASGADAPARDDLVLA
ncbi:PAP2 superfamily protein [Actinomadura pelletieri DSM 43383]|uniref:PAP2 superfamily protein n=1 Tax=Actinomadura pelletieri DSM 43383 TaxID=1120940 RepID=A0A495QB02_9ACTN|nr:PAP2 superfamily protein [Actinomadura pelletieri DSM 43383]